MGVTQLRSQASSEWAETWDWTKTLDLVGSIPEEWKIGGCKKLIGSGYAIMSKKFSHQMMCIRRNKSTEN